MTSEPHRRAIGSLRAVALDAPEIDLLATFYEQLAGWRRVPDDDDEWITIDSGDGWRIGLQRATDHVPPHWPDQDRPQQAHLDFRVADIDAAAERAQQLGASLLRRNERWHTLADPAGHPFDLCVNPDDPRTTLMAVMLDCPDAKALSHFYAELLGKPVTYEADGVAMIGEDGAQPVMFQQVERYTAPRWPDPAYPQQIHLDVTVQDVDAAERAALDIGATRLDGAGRTGASTPIRPASHSAWCGRSDTASPRALPPPHPGPEAHHRRTVDLTLATPGVTDRASDQALSRSQARSPRMVAGLLIVGHPPARFGLDDVQGQGLRDTGGGFLAFRLDRDADGRQASGRGRLHAEQLSAAAYLGADLDGSGEADPVEADVDAQGQPVDPEDLGHEDADQRQRQIAVGDGAAELACRGARRVGVNPLPVTGDVGEPVNLLLGHLAPGAEAQMLTGGGSEVGERGESSHGTELPGPVLRRASITSMSDQTGGPGPAEAPGFDTRHAHSARIYNYWLGGKDNYAADREAAEQAIAANPGIVTDVRANRAFLARAVRHLAAGNGLVRGRQEAVALPARQGGHAG